jgi:hypothetical protein
MTAVPHTAGGPQALAVWGRLASTVKAIDESIGYMRRVLESTEAAALK